MQSIILSLGIFYEYGYNPGLTLCTASTSLPNDYILPSEHNKHNIKEKKRKEKKKKRRQHLYTPQTPGPTSQYNRRFESRGNVEFNQTEGYKISNILLLCVGHIQQSNLPSNGLPFKLPLQRFVAVL